jgi:hypothetical protein
MVILMPRQGRPASERLLAVGIWALVGSLARVNPAVAGKGATITEGLYSHISRSPLQGSNLATVPHLSASLALMGLLASMYSLVNSQGGTLNELLSAGFANVGAVSGMNSF